MKTISIRTTAVGSLWVATAAISVAISNADAQPLRDYGCKIERVTKNVRFIETSQAEVRKITLHQVPMARQGVRS